MQSSIEKTLVARSPVIVIMGHIDHGKSSLLDYIRKTAIVESEAGGITQHISAYEIIHKDEKGVDRRITFLDTPGHEAFQGMRSRGAGIADIAVLVVSAEEGAKPQTLEAQSFIKERSIPYVVAFTKIDKSNADIERAKSSLLEKEIYLEGMGGDVPYVALSSKTGVGIPELLDTLLLVADLAGLKGNPEVPAEGVIIEANRDPKKGVEATLIIKNGTLKSGTYVRAGSAYAPVRIMQDFMGHTVQEASFSSPVRIVGFNEIPQVGSAFVTHDKKRDAEESATQEKERERDTLKKELTLPETHTAIIPLVIKADVLGTLEAVEYELGKRKSERAMIKFVGKGVGAITEGDVKSAGAQEKGFVIGFHVSADPAAIELARRLSIEVKTFDIIYKLTEWFEEAIRAREPRITVEELTGRAKVLKVFSRVKERQILGARVEEGEFRTGEQVRIMRRTEVIGQGKIVSLQELKTEVKSIAVGKEFGTQIQSKIEAAPGDTLEAFELVEK